jgi:hypothetical protein
VGRRRRRRRRRMDMRFGAFHGRWNFHTLRVDLEGLVRTIELNCLWSMAFRYVIGWVPAPLL